MATRPAGGVFGAAEFVTGVDPAVGIDAAGKVTLVNQFGSEERARTAHVGSSIDAATPEVLSNTCSSASGTVLDVASNGDAIAGFVCAGAGVLFAVREAGAWTTSSPYADSGTGSCPSPSPVVMHVSPSVAIDDQGHLAATVLRSTVNNFDNGGGGCTPDYTGDVLLAIPSGSTMVPGPTVATAHSSIVPPVPGAHLAIGGGSLIVGWLERPGGIEGIVIKVCCAFQRTDQYAAARLSRSWTRPRREPRRRGSR